MRLDFQSDSHRNPTFFVNVSFDTLLRVTQSTVGKARFVRNKKKQLPKGAAFIRVVSTNWFSNRFVEGLELIQSI